MKFNIINYNKIRYLLISGIILVNITSCSKKDKTTEYELPDEMTTNTIIATEQHTVNTQPSFNILSQSTSQNIENESVENTNTSTLTETDEKVLELFKKIEKEIIEIIENDKASIENAKATFVILVDFIFFDSEINNVKFDDLSEEGKQKILSISNSIDNKLESKFPNYKEEISEKAKNAYNKASELIKEGSENIDQFAKEKLDDKYYDALIEAKDDIKYYSTEAWELVKEFSISSFEKGKEYIKNWYNNFKNE